MKNLLKSEVCESRTVFVRPTDGLKMAEKSKFSAIVHAQYMNNSFCLQLRVQKKRKKKKKRKNITQDSAENAESKQAPCGSYSMYNFFFFLKVHMAIFFYYLFL